MLKIYHTFLSVLSFASLLFLCIGCAADDIPIPPKVIDSTDMEGKVAVWFSDKDGLFKIAKEANLLPFELVTDHDVNIEIDVNREFQTMEGFGAAMTGSSAFVLQNHLSLSERNTVLEDLFHPEKGIGISYIRLTIGASDFSLTNFTYNDLANGQQDLAQENFSLSREEQELIPILKKIIEINPNIKIMATPWSPPAWMKDNQSVQNGGRLIPSLQQSFATYLVKYINAMGDRGILIDAITVQNEPLYAAPYMSMEMSAQEQKVFIRDYLGPAFTANNINTKIIIYDHNWDDTAYSLDILSDATAKNFIAGTAFHCYAGNVSAMTQVHNAHPTKGIYFTECSGGDFSPSYSANLAWNTENLLVGATRNWSKTILFWNIALDQNHGPRNGGCQDCRGVVTVNSNTKVVTKNEEFVLLGHMTKFVKPGAKRIHTPDTRNQDISQVAFKNLDGSVIIVAFNHKSQAQNLRFQLGQDAFRYKIQEGSLATFVIEK